MVLVFGFAIYIKKFGEECMKAGLHSSLATEISESLFGISFLYL